MAWWKWTLAVLAVLSVGGIGFGYYQLEIAESDIYVPLFAAHCGDCHGGDLHGTDRGSRLVGGDLKDGATLAALMQSIERGQPAAGMPAFGGVLTGSGIDSVHANAATSSSRAAPASSRARRAPSANSSRTGRSPAAAGSRPSRAASARSRRPKRPRARKRRRSRRPRQRSRRGRRKAPGRSG